MELAANTWEGLFDQRFTVDVSAAPVDLQSWLLSDGSLTQKLTAICKHCFRVQLLHQTLTFATAAAAKTLDINEGEALLHREVLLCDGEKPLVFACSLLPERALNGCYEELRQLDERPLGQWIFAEPALLRSGVHYVALDRDEALFVRAEDALPESGEVWGRISCFSGAAAPLLVSEFFLHTAQP